MGTVKEIKQPFGMLENQLIHISELSEDKSGLKCNCLCPKCNGRLVAKMGKSKVHHFAHHTSDCGLGFETAIHLKAKEILARIKKINFPDLRYNHNGREIILSSSEMKTFDEVILEERIDSIIPDIVLIKGNQRVLVEVAVNHFVDDIKLEKIQNINLPTIEINLSRFSFFNNGYNELELEREIVLSPYNKKWLHNPDKEILINEFLKKDKIRRDELEKERIIEAENQRLADELKRKKRQEELEPILKLFDPVYIQSKRDIWKNELDKKESWKMQLSNLGITADNFPGYLNVEIDGDFLFQCDRRYWQLTIFLMFFKDKDLKENPKKISIERVIELLKKSRSLPIHKDLQYLNNIPELKGKNGLAEVLADFFEILSRYGYCVRTLRSGFVGAKFYWWFDRIDGGIKFLQETYRNERYAEKGNELIDKKLGLAIGKLSEFYK